MQWVSDTYVINKVQSELNVQLSNDKWKNQQILKLYSVLSIPNLLNNVLILDGEVLFRKRVTHTVVLDGQVVGLYNFGRHLNDRIHPDYARFLEHMVPGTKKTIIKGSMIAHHALIQKDILLDLMEYVEAMHHQPFWKKFLDPESGLCSEYELYVRYSLFRFPHRTLLRLLPYSDVGNCSYVDEYVWYISCHWHLEIHPKS